jgi:hypothetical protein
MNEPSVKITDENTSPPPDSPRKRSWRTFRIVVATLVTLFLVAAIPSWDQTFGGVSERGIAEFEQRLGEYFEEVKARGLTRVSMAPYNPLRPDQFSEASEIAKGTHDARERLRRLVDGMNYSNRQKAQAQFAFSAHRHNGDGIPVEVLLEGMDDSGRAWVMRNIPAGVWGALKVGAISFAAIWIFLKLCELFWWFLIDRLRDVADAVRKP